MALFTFESLAKAEAWVAGAAGVKEAGWCEKTDIIALPVKNAPGPGKPCVQMIDVKVVDEARFGSEYAPGHQATLKAAGGFPEVVCSNEITILRGQGKPSFIVLHAWAGPEEFKAFYNGGTSIRLTIIDMMNYSNIIIVLL